VSAAGTRLRPNGTAGAEFAQGTPTAGFGAVHFALSVDLPAIAVEQATILVGPALILTSVVLACGLAVMVFSDLPSLRLFGWLSAFAMLAALTADLLILRPTAMYVNQLAMRFKKK